MNATLTDPRNPAALRHAEEAVAAAERAERSAFDLVEHVGVELELGRATRGDLVRAKRTLAAAQESHEQAKRRVKAISRARDELAAAERADRESTRRARIDQLIPQRDALRDDVLDLIDGTLEAFQVLGRRIRDWRNEAGAVALSTSTLDALDGRIYDSAVDALTRLARNYDPRR